MILMNLELENIMCFNDFKMNLSYPKKIVNSALDFEYLKDFPNFRYRKINIIYGANATGKTSIAKALLYIVNFISNKNINNINELKGNSCQSYFLIDFLVQSNLYRVECLIENNTYTINMQKHRLLKSDTYEKAISDFTKKKFVEAKNNIEILDEFSNKIGIGWFFSFSNDLLMQTFKVYSESETKKYQLKILKNILTSLDSNIRDVRPLIDVKNEEIKDAYVIELRSNKLIICQNGKIIDNNILSSGTLSAFNLAVCLTSMLFNFHQFYYLDELFSYLNTDVEKSIISLISQYVNDKDEQVFITTHNLDISEINLPKHSFWFLRKEVNEDEQADINIISASDIIIKNNVNLRNAIENDVFNGTPRLEKIDELESLLEN